MAKKKAAPKKAKKAAPKKQSRRDAERALRTGPIRRRPRQERLPGVEEDPGSKKIDEAAYEYVEARDAMQAATQEVHRRELKLIAIVKKERPGHKAYRHTAGGETITVNIVAKDPTEKAKVKIAPVDEEHEPADEAGKGDEPAGDVHAMDAADGAGEDPGE